MDDIEISVQPTGRKLDNFRAVLLDLDVELTRKGLSHLYALGVEPLRIIDKLSQCQASVRNCSANAVILVPQSGSAGSYNSVSAARTLIGPDLGLCVVIRENIAKLEEELLVAGGDIAISLDGEATRQHARLLALTRRLQGNLTTSISEDLYIDSRARHAFNNGHLLPLTDRLFWVLEFMVNHPSEVLTQEDFCAMLTTKGIHIQAHSVSSLLYRLRRILERHGMSDQIRSIPKRGYRWNKSNLLGSSQRGRVDVAFTVDTHWHQGNIS